MNNGALRNHSYAKIPLPSVGHLPVSLAKKREALKTGGSCHGSWSPSHFAFRCCDETLTKSSTG